MRTQLPGLRALVTRPAQGVGQASAETVAANGAEFDINGRKKAESVIGVPTPGDTAGEVNIRVNNVGP